MKINILILALICPILDAQDPPPVWEIANMARYIMNQSNWTTLASISTRSPTATSPFANVFSIADGTGVDDSTGVPYFFVTPMDISIMDLQVDNRCSIALTLAQGDYCEGRDLDPEDPRCPHAIYTGHFVAVEEGSEEEDFARSALFSRHPPMITWPADFYFNKLEIDNIMILDYYGAAKTVDVAEYFAADPSGSK